MRPRRRGVNPIELMQARGQYESAVRLGRLLTQEGKDIADLYAQALYNLAQWESIFGHSHYDESGNWIQESDNAAALKLYREYLEQFSEGEASAWREVQNSVRRLTGQVLNVFVSNTFIPGKPLSFSLSFQNLDAVTAEVFKVDPADIRFPGSESAEESADWWDRIDLGTSEPVFSWKQEKPAEKYSIARETVRLGQGLPDGLYVIRASGGGLSARSWLLVTRVALVAKFDQQKLHAWAVDAETGEPLAGARLQHWFNRTQDKTRHWQSLSGETDADGLAELTFPDSAYRYQHTVLVAQTEKGPALLSDIWLYYGSDSDDWRVYAFTDRPAYRPEDTVHWKFVARLQEQLASYAVPAGEELSWRITGPRGQEVAKGKSVLNDYGSAWGELPLGADMALGMYRIQFQHKGKYIGNEELFRLEEYKLPEYKVTVVTSGVDGEPATAFRLGESIAVAVQADYYFGGPVADAQVEVVVRQAPFYQRWSPREPYAWLYEGTGPVATPFRGAQEVQRETLQTDSNGRAVFTLETSANANRDFVYAIEARVTDSSRREIIGQGRVCVTRQPYFAYLSPQRVLTPPGEVARITVKTLDANDAPVSATGHLSVTRQQWKQRWVGPQGITLSGVEYRAQRKAAANATRPFPEDGWRCVWEEEDFEQIASADLTTDADGNATYTFTVPQPGYYNVTWFSQGEDGYPIKAQTAVWSTNDSPQEISYPDGLQIIANADAFRAGEPAPVVISAPSPGATVWLTVQANGLLESRLVHLEGTVKLLQLDVTDAWVPNVFLGAVMVQEYVLSQDTLAVNVPPVKELLDVTVSTERETCEPREKAAFTLETRDHNGHPVPAEVSLSLFDESVLYIQPELAPAIAPFFYGQLRPNSVNTQNSVNEREFWLPDQKKAELAALDTWRTDARAVQPYVSQKAVGLASPDYFSPPEAGSLMAAPASVGAEMSMAEEESAVVVRHDFRATAYWNPQVMTGEDGTARVEITLPDSLTTWQAQARALSLPGKVGQGETQLTTRLPLIARLQMPRFLVTGDTATLSGVINNNTDEALSVKVSLTQEGEALELRGPAQTLTVPAQGEARADFYVKALTAGTPTLTLTAQGTHHADAMQLPLPVFEHGIEKLVATSGKMTADELTLTLDMPEFRASEASFEIYATPSLAATMLDALPYLAQYPYGCVEQTMSRFLPAVIVTRTLHELGLSEQDILDRAFGGIEGRSPGTDDNQLEDLSLMVSGGLDRLYDFQHADGGWGWWKGGDSDLYMSAYVVWGLTLCQQADVKIRSDVLQRGQDFLQKRLVEADTQPDLAAWLLHALASRYRGNDTPAPTEFEQQAFARLWECRTQLNACTRALAALAAVDYSYKEQAATLAGNLENGVIRMSNILGAADAPETAHWGNDSVKHGWHRWSDSSVEATAFAIQALLATGVHPELREQAVNWLVQNRRGAQWSNTRDTAIAVLTLNDYLQKSGQLDAAIDYEILLNGEPVAKESVPAGHGPLAPSVFTVDASRLKTGTNTLSARRTTGTAPLYVSARANFFTLENPIEPAGNYIMVKRDFYRLRSFPTLLDGFREEKTPLAPGDTVRSGDRLEVVLTVQAMNDLEYLVFEDLKAAGFEATQLQSGAPLYARELRPQTDANGQKHLPAEDAKDRYTGRQRWVYQELRDRKIASFVDKLPEGYWELRYTLRAETPGTFSALPVIGEAMYVPEIRANSAEFKVTVED